MKIGRVFGVLVWVGVLGVCFGEVGKEAAKEELNAEEVLRRFAEARKNMNSFHITGESYDNWEYRGKINAKGQRHFRFDYRYDGNRCATRRYNWGDRWGDLGARRVDKDNPKFLFSLWDGDDWYTYGRESVKDRGLATLARASDPGGVPKEYVTCMLPGSSSGLVMGYCVGDDLTINELFTGDDARVTLRENTERIRGADCHVLRGRVRGRGTYTFWMDAARDWHIVRSEISRIEGDKFRKNAIREGEYSKKTWQVTEWQKVGDSWFPQKCVTEEDQFYGGKRLMTKGQVKFDKVVFDPDHEVLGSFLTTDIPEGSPVLLAAASRPTKYIWKDGKVVDGQGKEVELGKEGNRKD